MSEKQSYRDLKVWRLGCELTVEVYRHTEAFPKPEVYGLTQQMRRAAYSVPANIAESCARRGIGEFNQFLHITVGSLAELDTFLEITGQLGYGNADTHAALCDKTHETGCMLYGLINSLRSGSRPK